MNLSELAENLLRLALLLAGLLVPGSMLLRALRLPWSLAAAFVGSSILLYGLMLGFSVNDAPVSLPTVGLSLALVSLLARLVPVRNTDNTISSSFACFTRLGGWTPLYALFWVIVCWRLATQPLTGPDVYFRWSWLAEQIVNVGSLDFYPSRSGGDFVRYFWAESIPPGVASLYTWAYLCGGSTLARWTSPIVALQLLALHELVWRLGSRWGGERVARCAVVLAAATPLLTWSVLIGQESGLMAVAVCGVAWSLAHLREPDGARWAVLAGIFAVAAASTREYGIAFAFTAVLLGLVTRIPRRQATILALVALPLALAWPLRVWWLTGNPFHSLDLAGLFPVNAMFAAWSTAFHAPHQAALASGAAWVALGRYLILWALPAVLGAAVLVWLLVKRLHDAHVPAVLVVLTVVLWYWSLPYTAGGLFYSLRVLSPAFGLLAVVAAYSLGSQLPASAGRYAFIALSLLLAEALPKTLVLPQNPYQIPLAGWPHAGRQFTDSVRVAEQRMLDTFQKLPATKRVVTDNAGMPRVFARIGVEVIPLWSPEIAWLFDRTLPPTEIARRWSESGIRYLVLSKSSSGSEFVTSRAQWRAPYFAVRTVAESGNDLIVEALAQSNGPTP